MLIKRSYGLDARRRVMNLVERQPPALLVSQNVPPIKEKRADKPADETLSQRHLPRGQIEKGNAAKQLDPQARRSQRYEQLRAVDEKRT